MLGVTQSFPKNDTAKQFIGECQPGLIQVSAEKSPAVLVSDLRNRPGGIKKLGQVLNTPARSGQPLIVQTMEVNEIKRRSKNVAPVGGQEVLGSGNRCKEVTAV